MLAGHFTTAILAKQRAPLGHFAFYLVACQLPDLLWLCFHYLGLEPTLPDNVLVVTLQTLDVDMTYSHDLLPMPLWAALALVAGRALFGAWKPGLVGAALVLVHAVTDYVGGFEHFVFGPDSQVVATGFYETAPYVAITLELAFIVVTMAWVLRTDAAAGIRRTPATWVTWAAVFGGGLAFLYLTATHSTGELLGIEASPALSGTTVPVLGMTYISMLLALAWAEGRNPSVAAAG
ncbi:MAG: hypothetical protein AAF799_02415 [Myxococcota bacterium]